MTFLESAQPTTKKYTGNLSASFETSGLECVHFNRGMISATWSGNDGFSGTMQIEISQDNTNWNLLGGKIALSNAADCQTWILTEISYRYIRVKYIRDTATTGTVAIIVDLMS